MTNLHAFHFDLERALARGDLHPNSLLEHSGSSTLELVAARLAGWEPLTCRNRTLHDRHVAVDTAVRIFAPFALLVPLHCAEHLVASGTHLDGTELLIFHSGMDVRFGAERAVVGTVGILMAADAIDSVWAFLRAQIGMFPKALNKDRFRGMTGETHLQRAVSGGSHERIAFPRCGMARLYPIFCFVGMAGLAIAPYFGGLFLKGAVGRSSMPPNPHQHQEYA